MVGAQNFVSYYQIPSMHHLRFRILTQGMKTVTCFSKKSADLPEGHRHVTLENSPNMWKKVHPYPFVIMLRNWESLLDTFYHLVCPLFKLSLLV